MRSRVTPLNALMAALTVLFMTTFYLMMAALPASAATAWRMVVESSQKCLDIPFGDPGDGVVLQQFTCHGADNQRWWLMPRTDGFYTIASVKTNKCLDVRSASTADQALVQQFTCHNGLNQQWRFNSNGSFVARHSGKCLDIRGGGTEDHAVAQQFTCHGGLNQRWTLYSS